MQYKQKSNNSVAIGIQLILVFIFLMGLVIYVFDELADIDPSYPYAILGIYSVWGFVVCIVLFSFVTLVLFAGLLVYQSVLSSEIRILLLTSSGTPPELSLFPDMQWHLFLSHVWSSGQDQVAIIKRKLQLLIPGIQVFLDVDDLKEIGDLESYIKSSQCVLIFLSKGYFSSANCLREYDSTLSDAKPIVLVHEKAPQRGGATLDVLRAECIAKDRDPTRVFSSDSIIDWHRVAAFQLMSLKLIAYELLLASPSYSEGLPMQRRSGGKEDVSSSLFVPGELSLKGLSFKTSRSVNVFVSPNNPGARQFVTELQGVLRPGAISAVFETPPLLAEHDPLTSPSPRHSKRSSPRLDSPSRFPSSPSRSHQSSRWLLNQRRKYFEAATGITHSECDSLLLATARTKASHTPSCLPYHTRHEGACALSQRFCI